MNQLLTVAASPHLHTRRTVSTCMWNVIIALLPALAASLWFFGVGAAIVITTAIAGCIATEYAVDRWLLKRQSSILNGSAVLTGLLLAFNLPSNLPVWLVLIGSVVAVGIGKMAFGGLGCNIWNPALVGRVFLLISFPVQMTTWPVPLANRWAYTDATTGATTLQLLKLGDATTGATPGEVARQIDLWDNAIGAMGGSLGEVSAIALCLGLAYLLLTRTITWHIPVAVVGSFALFTWAIGGNVAIEILSGGLLLGAFFMATDYVTRPVTKKGQYVYGVLLGILTGIFRIFGPSAEGVSYAIIIGNLLVPLIEKITFPKAFGEGGEKV